MPCPVLTKAVSGTGEGYVAMRCLLLVEAVMLCDIQYWCYLRCYAMSGTDPGYAATRTSCLDGPDGSWSCDCQVSSAIGLRAWYAISGTDIAYGPRPTR
eukprot:2534343-Rhodomonas_salina.3